MANFFLLRLLCKTGKKHVVKVKYNTLLRQSVRSLHLNSFVGFLKIITILLFRLNMDFRSVCFEIFQESSKDF